MEGESTGSKGASVAKILIGLLLVAAAIGGAVAVLVPKGHPRWIHNETSAVAALRTYVSAQTLFHRADLDGDRIYEYAEKMPVLTFAKDSGGKEIGLLSKQMAAAYGAEGKPYNGYLFKEVGSLAGNKIDWVGDYALCAIPAKYGTTGKRTFVVTTNGTVYSRDQDAQGTFTTNFPADPKAGGWKPID